MSMCNPIVFLDSGVGGLPYLKQVREILPRESYVYVADNAEFPYGEKQAEEVRSVVVERVRLIEHVFDPKTVVIACNTASVAALSVLRESFDFPFVGVVPAVKPAAEQSAVGRIGLLATNGTISDAYTEGLIEEFASSCSVTRIGDGRIVDFIETEFLGSSRGERRQVLSPSIEKMIAAGIDTLVIGCTHFIYIEEDLHDALAGKVSIVDSREGVTNQILRIVGQRGYREGTPCLPLFFATGPDDRERFTEFSGLFDLEYRGVLLG